LATHCFSGVLRDCKIILFINSSKIGILKPYSYFHNEAEY
jgi:hypothetical protein